MFKNKPTNRKRLGNYYINKAPPWGGVLNPKLRNKFLLIFSMIAGVVLIICLILEGAGYYVLHHRKMLLIKSNAVTVSNDKNTLNNLEEKNGELVNKIKTLAPSEVYIVVDTAQNILYLKKKNEVTRKVVVSTGSGNVLKELTGRKRTWTFDTPKGEFAIKTLTKDPIWTAPDWEFISNGEPIPKKKEDRIQEGILGDYKLGIGNDIYFHGTIYVRTMGKHVTHGCIRVGDDDLTAMWKASKIGTKVFIF
jgi:hypothetical protein